MAGIGGVCDYLVYMTDTHLEGTASIMQARMDDVSHRVAALRAEKIHLKERLAKEKVCSVCSCMYQKL